MPALPPKVALDLKYALLDAYRELTELKQFATYYLDLNIERLDGSNLEDKAHALLQWSASRGRVEQLLDGLTADRPDNPLLGAAVQRARANVEQTVGSGWYREPDDPLKTLFLKGGRAFIDRSPFRTSLQRLITDDASTLVVTGKRFSGKSYSYRFVIHIADAYGYKVVQVRLAEMGTGFGPDDLAAIVVTEMGRKESLEHLPKRAALPARWTEELRSFVTGEITASRATWWIVIDGVDTSYVRADTLDLINKLVIAADERSHPMRVILLDCVAPLPPDVDPYAEKEQIKAINVAVLRDYFRELADHLGADADDAAIQRAVDEVQRLAPPGPHRLRRLATAVEQVAKGLPA